VLIQDQTATSATLLLNVRDWRNAPAWQIFFAQYNRLLDRWCREYFLDPASAEEVCQQLWIELAERMRTFRYDPSKSFRGWLRRLCRCRAADFLRKQYRENGTCRPLDDAIIEMMTDESGMLDSELDDEAPIDNLHDLLREADAVQQAARSRLNNPRTWAVFWQIAIVSRPIAEVSREFGMSYTAAFAAYGRAARILREEGQRHRDGELPVDIANPISGNRR
jgi:RNA polymerase sigma-70 factor (ECF subfamily)